MARFLKIEEGLKFECSKAAFESISSDEYINENFTLNVRKLKGDNFSVYVDEKTPGKDVKWCKNGGINENTKGYRRSRIGIEESVSISEEELNEIFNEILDCEIE